MKKEFEPHIWRRYYDQINILGQYLKDSRPDWEGNPPKFKISREERRQVEKQIEEITLHIVNYLEDCYMRPHEPKWYYSSTNETTWASSDKFQYGHLICRKKYVTISV